MCGRFTLTLSGDSLAELFELLNAADDPVIDAPPRYNIAPTQPIAAIRHDAAGRRAHLVRWGLVPAFVADPRDFPLLVNARAETMAEKPAFRASLRHQRCVVPASGYYEWLKRPDGAKVPHYVARADGMPMALAGLWSTWTGPDGEEVDTAAIVTVATGQDTAHLHPRSPAILDAGAIGAWLDVRGVDAREAAALVRIPPAGTVVVHPVSTRVNSVANDGPELIVPAAEAKPVKPEAPARPPDQLDLF